jgi:broad specificity phosphatase PhoE
VTGHTTELWIMRHGETAWSALGRHTGRSDVPLTSEGEGQARALGARLPPDGFDLVLCSPLQRAVRTAELAGLADVRHEPLAMEWDYGAYEGLTRAQIRERTGDPGWSVWTARKLPDGETIDQVSERARALLDRVRAVRPSRGTRARVALVAHAHLLRILATQWIGQDVALARHLLLGPASLGLLGNDRGICVIGRWNT